MYQPLYTKQGELKHSTECKMAFGRKDKECPRCVELLSGAATRSGWQKHYYANEAQKISDIKEHSKTCKCFPLCTYGEW